MNEQVTLQALSLGPIIYLSSTPYSSIRKRLHTESKRDAFDTFLQLYHNNSGLNIIKAAHQKPS